MAAATFDAFRFAAASLSRMSQTTVNDPDFKTIEEDKNANETSDGHKNDC
jgi:hypothetical protein